MNLVSLCIEGVDLNADNRELETTLCVSLCIEGVDLNISPLCRKSALCLVSLCIEGVDLNIVI